MSTDAALDALKHWLEGRGAVFGHLALTTFPGGLRGVAASSDVAPGEPLLRVPSSLFVTADTARGVLGPAYPGCALFSEECMAEDADAVVVAAFVLHEVAAGEASEWAPWIAALPTPADLDGVPLLWTPGRLAALGDPVLAAGVAGRLAAHGVQFRALVDGCGGGPALFGRFKAKDYLWARAVCASRSFLNGLCIDFDGPSVALVPYADMFNHTAKEATCAPSWAGTDMADGAYELPAARGYAPGRQVFISYGDLSSEDMLDVYGFVEAVPLAHEHVSITRPTVEGGARSKVLLMACLPLDLQEEAASCDDPMVVDMLLGEAEAAKLGVTADIAATDAAILPVFRIAAAPQAAIAAHGLAVGPYRKRCDAAWEAAALNAALTACKAAVSPTSDTPLVAAYTANRRRVTAPYVEHLEAALAALSV